MSVLTNENSRLQLDVDAARKSAHDYKSLLSQRYAWIRAPSHYHVKCMLSNREDDIESLTLTIRELQETVRDLQDAAASAQINAPFASGTLVFSDIEEKSNALEKELGSLKVPHSIYFPCQRLTHMSCFNPPDSAQCAPAEHGYSQSTTPTASCPGFSYFVYM